MTIPTHVTSMQFQKYLEPHLSKAKRGYVCKIPLFAVVNYILYFLHTGCQWKRLPIALNVHTGRREISYQAIYYHFRKWSRDGSWHRAFEHSVRALTNDVNLSEIHLDGTHTLAKKGGVCVIYQGRKKAKTSNIIAVTDAQGFILATTAVLPGNHHDAYNVQATLHHLFTTLKHQGMRRRLCGSYFHADASFDTAGVRKFCFNHQMIPSIPENVRNRSTPKRGRKRFFDETMYRHRFTIERSFAWVDKFKRVAVRFERDDTLFFALNIIAFTMINLRFLFNAKV